MDNDSIRNIEPIDYLDYYPDDKPIPFTLTPLVQTFNGFAETCRHCGTTRKEGHYGAGLSFTCKSDMHHNFTPGPTYEQLEAELSALREARQERPVNMPTARKLTSRWGGYKILPVERSTFTETEADYIVSVINASK